MRIGCNEMGGVDRTTRTLGLAVQAVLLVVLLAGIGAEPVRAQVRGARALRSLNVKKEADGFELTVRLDFTVRYLRHVPDREGRSVRIQVEPLDLGTVARLGGVFRETLPLADHPGLPLVEVTYDQRTLDESYVELQFSERVEFDIRQGNDLRTLTIRLRLDGASEGRGAPTDSTALAEKGEANGALVAAARVAIRDGELDRAIALLTKVLEPSDAAAAARSSQADRRVARELLGLTRERRGQFAHARAEYELYLAEYPDGEGADRVRQRLEALITASSLPTPTLRKPTAGRSRPRATIAEIPLEYDAFGSLGLRYFRTDAMIGDGEGGFLASDLLTDFDIASRVEAPAFTVRTDFTGTYDADIAEGSDRTSDYRISRLSIEVEDKLHGVEATLGRQRRSDSGILGRFDGLRVSVEAGRQFDVSALVGLPVESTSDAAPNTDTVLFGGAIDAREIGLKGLDAQFFVVGQRTSSMMDRGAIGGDLRFSNDKTYSFVYFDYDFLFEALNTMILSTTWYWSDDTRFRAQLDRRKTPILQLQTALQGQTITDLDGLRDFLSEGDIRRLAEDRTQLLWTGSAGFTHKLTEKLQLSGDLYVTQSSKTEAVLDARTGDQIPGVEAVGPNVSISSQLLMNDWLIEDGIGSVSARYFEGETSRALSFTGFGRFPLAKGLRANPRLRWEWRDSEVQAARSTLTPSLEFDWRYEAFRLDAEAGIEWAETLSSGDQDRRTSYFVELGARFEF